MVFRDFTVADLTITLSSVNRPNRGSVYLLRTSRSSCFSFIRCRYELLTKNLVEESEELILGIRMVKHYFGYLAAMCPIHSEMERMTDSLG